MYIYISISKTSNILQLSQIILFSLSTDTLWSLFLNNKLLFIYVNNKISQLQVRKNKHVLMSSTHSGVNDLDSIALYYIHD